jgi:hypothetical protein
MVSVAECQPNIPELADGASCKMAVEQLVSNENDV